MLSMEQRRKTQLYSYRGGMLNISWVAGYARRLTPTGGFIQQTNNLNHMIPFTLADGMIMPTFVKDKTMIKVRGRMHGGATDQGEPIIVLRAFDIEEPNIFDMPSRESWNLSIHPGTPIDKEEPETYGASVEEGVAEDSFRMPRMPSSANISELAGFISGMRVEQPSTKPDGQVNKGCLIIGIRQTPDPEDILPVRVYGPQVTALRRKLMIGMPIKIRGQLRVRNKNTGVPAGPDGVLPTHKWLYLHAQLNDFREAKGGVDIKEMPAWVGEMRQAYEERRAQRIEANQAQAAANRQAAEAAPTQAKPKPAKPAAGPAPAPTATPEAKRSSEIDPAVLAQFGAKAQ